MDRRGFVGAALVAIAGMFGLKTAASSPADKKVGRLDYRIFTINGRKVGEGGMPGYRIFRTDTGERIYPCFFFDDSTGEFGHYVYNEDETAVMMADDRWSNERPYKNAPLKEVFGCAPLRLVPLPGPKMLFS
jgi:hypothetical protein